MILAIYHLRDLPGGPPGGPGMGPEMGASGFLGNRGGAENPLETKQNSMKLNSGSSLYKIKRAPNGPRPGPPREPVFAVLVIFAKFGEILRTPHFVRKLPLKYQRNCYVYIGLAARSQNILY